MVRGTRALTAVVLALALCAGLFALSLMPAPPRAGAQDPTLDAALNAIAQRTREAAVTQTREARNALQTREARDAQIIAERATAQAIVVEQTRTALEQTRATLTRQAEEARAMATTRAEAAATMQARASATAHAERIATASAEATATADARATATARAEATAIMQAHATATVRAQATLTQVAAQRAEDARQQRLFLERATVVGAVGASGVAIVVLVLTFARWVWTRAKKPTVVQIVEEPVSSRSTAPPPAAPTIERIEETAPPSPPQFDPTLPRTRIVLSDPAEIELLDEIVAAQRTSASARPNG